MAFALIVASPYALRYTATASGAGTDNTLTRAQMLSDAVAGPLKSKLQGATTGPLWLALIEDPALSVYSSPRGGTPAVIGPDFGNPGSVPTLQLTALAAGAATIELRINHSIDQ